MLIASTLQGQIMVPVYQVVSSNAAFGIDAFKTLTRSNSRSNFVFSPYAISSSMAIAYLGMEGKTAEETKKVLRYPVLAPFLGETFKRLNGDLSEDSRLGIAIALWVQEGLPLTQEFQDKAKQYYEGRFFTGDFNVKTDSTRNEINKWVSLVTRKAIPFFMGVADFPRGAEILLISTITLNANWETPFSARDTKTQNFFAEKISQRPTPMMHAAGEFPYFENEALKVVEIPYAALHEEKGRLGLWIVLPKKVDGLKALEESLTSAMWEEWKKNAYKKPVKLTLPRFRINQILKGETVLQEMGLKLPFEKGADFSKMTASEASIGRIFQKAFFSIDEKGTMARNFVPPKPANKGAPPSEEMEFVADHPFLFFVTDDVTGQLLFLGHMVQP